MLVKLVYHRLRCVILPHRRRASVQQLGVIIKATAGLEVMLTCLRILMHLTPARKGLFLLLVYVVVEDTRTFDGRSSLCVDVVYLVLHFCKV